MERMMTRHMPFSENLYRAFLSKEAIEDFTVILTRATGFQKTLMRISSTQGIEEMSIVRHLHTRDYLRQNSRNETPIHSVSQVPIKESENLTYIPKNSEEAIRQTFS
jgi:hypothetical protein